MPGPACYDQGGTEPTNTDANLVLGILPERGLLGGRKPLSIERAREAIRTRIAEPLGLSVEDAAAAIYAVQNAQTGDLLRKTVVESGYDPREFVLYAFGGAGPAHCAAYAAELGVAEVVVPLGQVASAFSAYGLASSDIVVAAELSDPAAMPLDPVRVDKNFADLEAQVRQALERQGVQYSSVQLDREIDMRFTMQLAELAVPVPSGPIDDAVIGQAGQAFERRYAELYGEGTGFSAAGIQAITYRVRGTGVLPFSPRMPELDPPTAAIPPTPGSAAVRSTSATAPASSTPPSTTTRACAPVTSSTGPAVIEVPTTTVVVPAGRTGTVDRLGNLSITSRQESSR